MKRQNRKKEYYFITDRLIRNIRYFFYRRGFIELDPPLMVPSPGIEPHLEAFGIFYKNKFQCYLPTSPEFYIKSVIAGGLPRAFALSHSFRAGECGSLNKAEFLMLEWYRTKTDYIGIMRDCEGLIKHMIKSAKVLGLSPPPVKMPITKISLDEAFLKYTGLSWMALKSLSDWQKHCIRNGAPNGAKNWSLTDCYSFLLVSKIEQNLSGGPVIIYDFPSFQCALARSKKDNPDIIERFEIYWNGIELANAYSELTDKKELLRRYGEFSKEITESGRKPYPLDEDFVKIHDHLPECGGIALGIDRLFSILAGEEKYPFLRRDRDEH